MKFEAVSDRITLGSAVAFTPWSSVFLLIAAAIAIALAAFALPVLEKDALSSVVRAASIAMSLMTRVSPFKTPTLAVEGVEFAGSGVAGPALATPSPERSSVVMAAVSGW